MNRSTASVALGALFVAVAGLGTYLTTRSPAAVSEDAPLDRFSALRAARHLDVIAHETHAMGTAAHDRVRDYLIRELEAMGFDPEVQSTTAVRKNWYGISVAANVANVMVRMDGRQDGKALLLLCHYDSAPGSYGASDDGAAVAAMLETLRILEAAPPLRNDVIALFTDAEEAGLVGAAGFLERHPWAGDVGMVVNFDARGTGGPVLMFETSAGNGRLIREFRRAVPDPVASSLSDAVYRQLPNDSDFTLFRQRGIPGLNFAFIHGGTAYHTAQDSIERLDLGTLQQQGESLLGLARHFGEIDLDGGWTAQGDAVYFDLIGSVLVAYPGAVALPLAAALLLGSAGLAVFGFRHGRLTRRGFAVAFVAIAFGAALLGFALRTLARLLVDQGYNFVLLNGWTSQSLALLGLALVAAGVSIAAFRPMSARLGADNVIVAGLLFWSLLGIAVFFVLPGGSYLFAVPVLAALPAAFIRLRERRLETVPAALFAALAVGAAGAALLWPPVLALVGVALGPDATSLVVGAAVWLLLAGLLAPHLALSTGRRRWFVPAAGTGLGAVLLALVATASSYGPGNRQPDTILYALDTETDEAVWLSYDEAPDPWTAQFLGETPERTTAPGFLRPLPVLSAPAPIAPLQGAVVELSSAGPVSGGRELEARVRWPYRTQRAVVQLRSRAQIRRVSIDNQEIRAGANAASVIFYAPPQTGIVFDVELADSAPLEVEAVAQIFSLPALEGFTPQPRPARMMPAMSGGRGVDSTFVRSVDVLAPGAARQSGQAHELRLE